MLEKSEENLSKNKFSEHQHLLENPSEHTVSRPPRPPGPTLGPYLQFITTDLENMTWIGSILLFHNVSHARPTIKFTADVKISQRWEILYENLYSMRAYRINLDIELRRGNDDEKIDWTVDWGNHMTSGSFYIAQYDQKWRGACFSCNGFDATVSKEVALGLTYDVVWNHLLSVHEENPFHLLIWGGDQNYHDFVLEDVPFLVNWSKMEWDQKWIADFSDESVDEIEKYYFYNYTEHWSRRLEMRQALGSIPGVMMWDDHDIFDGAGSYPPLLHDSPIMLGLFKIAQKMRLLFQHHTTPEKAREHRLFGYQSYNLLARCGPHLALLGADGRSERDHKTVQHDRSWDMIFEKLDNEVQDVKHLIVLFPVPFSFARFKMAESLLEQWKKLTMKWQNMPFSEQTNSVFGLPELYDDLLDEWTHEAHIDERNRALYRFQSFANRTRTRVTFFSGDVHCCGISRFQSRNQNTQSPLNDSKLMYQIISSAIVNRPPPKIVIRAAHLFSTKWYPIVDTVEELVDFFERDPEYGTKLFLKKLLPNRNWCYFEQRTVSEATLNTTVTKYGFMGKLFWPFIDFLILLVGLAWIFDWNRQKNIAAVKKRIYNKSSTTSDVRHEVEQEPNSLRIQLFLENTKKQKYRPPFSKYDLIVPDLK